MLMLAAFLWRVEGLQLSAGVPVAWLTVAGPELAATIHTLCRLARGDSTEFDPVVLGRSGHYAAGALVSFFALGYLGVLVAAPLMVAAGATLAQAWVRGAGTDAVMTRMIGAVLPFLLFIAGLNIDERPIVGAVLFAMSLSALLRLWLIRRSPGVTDEA